VALVFGSRLALYFWRSQTSRQQTSLAHVIQA
jgi:hypothetical protein